MFPIGCAPLSSLLSSHTGKPKKGSHPTLSSRSSIGKAFENDVYAQPAVPRLSLLKPRRFFSGSCLPLPAYARVLECSPRKSRKFLGLHISSIPSNRPARSVILAAMTMPHIFFLRWLLISASLFVQIYTRSDPARGCKCVRR